MKDLTLLIKPVSGACQYACKYCFYREETALRQKTNATMTLSTLEAIVRKAFAAAERRVTFAFQGGEPTLAGMDFFREVTKLQKRYAREKSYVNTLQTNGGLIDEQWATFLKEENFLVGLSLDGEETVHDACRLSKTGEGTWLRTIAAAQLLKEHEVPFNILCVVTGANAARPKHTYEALRSYRFLQFIPCLEPLRGEGGYAPTCEAYADFLDQTFALYKRDFLNNDYVSVRLFDNYVQMLIGMRPESCAMNGRCSVSFTIESDGSVYPCDFYCLDEWRLGSILENSFMELNNCARAAEFVNSSVRLHADCRACKYFSLCRGGCRRERACTQNGELLLNRYCAAYKHFFEKNYDGLLEIKDLALKSMRR